MLAFKNSHLFRVTIKTKSYSHKFSFIVYSTSPHRQGIWNERVHINHENRVEYLFGCWPTNSNVRNCFPRKSFNHFCALGEIIKSSEHAWLIQVLQEKSFPGCSNPLQLAPLPLLHWDVRDLCVVLLRFPTSTFKVQLHNDIIKFVLMCFSLIRALVLVVLGKILKLNIS